VSGHITALAISVMMMIGVPFVFFFGDLIVGIVGRMRIHGLLVALFLPTYHLISFVAARCILPYNVVYWVSLMMEIVVICLWEKNQLFLPPFHFLFW
jgi:hypothetical protein